MDLGTIENKIHIILCTAYHWWAINSSFTSKSNEIIYSNNDIEGAKAGEPKLQEYVKLNWIWARIYVRSIIFKQRSSQNQLDENGYYVVTI